MYPTALLCPDYHLTIVPIATDESPEVQIQPSLIEALALSPQSGYSPGSNKLGMGSEFYGSIYGGYGGQMSWRGSQVQL